jgi:uncharacterized membrane protein
VADLVAIGYDDEETASKAAEEVYRLSSDLVIQPEAVAVIVRDKKGPYHVTTNHHPVAAGLSWGMLWGALFGLPFFIPVFGLAVGGAFGTLFGALEKAGIDAGFQQQVRDMLQPGTSALFLIVEKMTTDKALEALGKYGGKVLKSSLSKNAEPQLQEALHGTEGSAGTSEPATAAASS